LIICPVSVSRTYDHDALGRLRREKLPSGAIVESFDYDPVGNRRSRSLGAATTSYQYPAGSHRLSAVGSASRSYTGNGNTSLMTAPAGATTLAHSVDDRMSSVTRGTVTTDYAYNALGERVGKSGSDT
jgi:hypothetical protein